MDKKNSTEKKILIVYFLAAVLLIPVLFGAHFAGYNTDTFKDIAPLATMDQGWTIQSKDGSDVPVTLPVDSSGYANGKSLTISRILTQQECKVTNYIMFLAYHSAVQIYVGDEQMYDFAPSGSVFALAPSAYHFFQLKDSYAGQKLTIVITSESSKYQGDMEEVYIGEKASELMMVIHQNIFAAISYIILFAIGLIFLIIWIYIKLFSEKFQSNSLLFLSLFSFSMFLGGIIDSKLPQLFFNNLEPLCILSYESIIFMEMAVTAYFLCDRNPMIVKATSRVAFVPVANFVITNALFLLQIVNLEDSIFVTHISIGILAAVEVIGNVRARRMDGHTKEKMQRRNGEKAGFFFLALTVCIDIARYYAGQKSDFAVCTRFGIIVYIMLLGIRTLQEHADVLAVEERSRAYKQLALHDWLTGLSNRTAYENDIASLNTSEVQRSRTIIIMFDINDLKKINDEAGHEKGDQYIKDFAAFITQYLGKAASIYRIGGDEFAAIGTYDDRQTFAIIYEEMEKAYKNADRSRINFAYGYAAFNDKEDHNLYDTAKRADMDMYACKAQSKKNVAPR